MTAPRSLPNRSATALAAAILIACSLPAAIAQQGDKKDPEGFVQREVWRDVAVPPAPVLSPEEALKTIRVADGFEVQLVAAEPLINDPVAIAWDPEGRIWAVEMRGFMPDVDGTGEEDGPPLGRVVVLEDLDGDGRMDRSTVFLDGLRMPRAIAFVEGGVLIGDPPSLLYCQDNDGDLRCDQTRNLGEYAKRGSVEHSENGLLPALDNWLYNAKSNRRLRFADGKIIAETTANRGQWGIAMDDYGRLFYNTNSQWLFSDYYPWPMASANPGYSPQAGFNQHVTRNQSVFTDRINPGVNRGYQDKTLRDDFRLNTVTAVCGPTIYRGETFPEEYRGNAFIPEPSGNAVGRFTLLEDGIALYGKHQTEPGADWERVEFLGSTDERFRPVSSYTGPDGNLYIVDMYRGIVQHKIFVTTFLRKQIIERGLDKPVGHGRIYRVVHKSSPAPAALPQPSQLSPLELVATLDHENGWRRDTAQQLLVQRRIQEPATIAALKNLAANGSERGKLHALWTLDGIAQIDEPVLEAALADSSEWVRSHALQIAAQADLDQAAPRRMIGARLDDRAFRVRLSAFQALHAIDDSRFVADRFVEAAEEDWSSPHFQEAAVSSLSGHEPTFLAAVRSSEIARPVEGLLATVETLAQALLAQADYARLNQALQAVATDGALAPVDRSFVGGLLSAIRKKSDKPLLSDAPPEIIGRLAQIDSPDARDFAARLPKLFRRPGDPIDAPPELVLTAAEAALVESGAAAYAMTCFPCHGNEGQGMPGLAPALDNSPWVTGSKERLALVVAFGLSGPIEIDGTLWNAEMPAHRAHPLLAGDKLAAVLSYIRSAWSNAADPIAPDELEAILAPHQTRDTPWTAPELDKLLGPVHP